MKNYIRLLAAAVPLVLSLSANAATFNAGVVNGGNTYTHDFTNGAGDAASDFIVDHWIDHMEFTLTTTSLVEIFAGKDAYTFFLNTGDPNYTFIAQDTEAPLSLAISLGAGSYQVDIRSRSGVFTGGLTVAGVAAVPEPEIYALMLAGLALVGFSARRRQA